KPTLEEGGDHTVAGGEAAHPRADRRHLAGTVRARNERQLEAAAVLALDDEEVAVVERDRAHAHQHLARPRLGAGELDRAQGGETIGLEKVIGLHGIPQVKCSRSMYSAVCISMSREAARRKSP